MIANFPTDRSWRRVAVVAAAAVVAGAAFGSLLVMRRDTPPVEISADEPEASETEPLALEFTDASGRDRSLAEFGGKAVVLNLWATWCVPCREEMPTLDRLQATLGGPEFEVVAVSVDRGGVERVAEFLAEIGTQHLAIYLADMAAVRREIGVFGLPTTLLIDRDGREVHRIVGPAEWDSREMTASIRERLNLAGELPDSEGETP